MPEQNFADNTLYELDNLDVLRGMNSETIDLIWSTSPAGRWQTPLMPAHYAKADLAERGAVARFRDGK